MILKCQETLIIRKKYKMIYRKNTYVNIHNEAFCILWGWGHTLLGLMQYTFIESYTMPDTGIDSGSTEEDKSEYFKLVLAIGKNKSDSILDLFL